MLHFLQPPLTKEMHANVNKWTVIRKPFPKKCALVQKLLADMISNHRAVGSHGMGCLSLIIGY